MKFKLTIHLLHFFFREWMLPIFLHAGMMDLHFVHLSTSTIPVPLTLTVWNPKTVDIILHWRSKWLSKYINKADFFGIWKALYCTLCCLFHVHRIFIFRKLADICPLLEVDDMVRFQKPDWKCVFTYVQSFYRRFRNVPLPQKPDSKESEQEKASSPSTNDNLSVWKYWNLWGI